MIEISLEYWNKLAEQTILISSLLAGFSIAVIANFLVSKINTRIYKAMMKAAVVAACSFLVSVFAMTKMSLMTSEGYPFKLLDGDLNVPRFIGVISLFVGVFSLLTVISLSGWTKSKAMGRFTTAIGIITLILFFILN